MKIRLTIAARVYRGGEQWRAAGSDADARSNCGTPRGPSRRRPRPPATSADPVERLVYSREQAAQALGVSPATLDRRVVPAIATVKTEWGARLIPVSELEGKLAEFAEEPRMPRRGTTRSGRRSTLPAEVVARIRRERAQGSSLAEIAHRLNRLGPDPA